ncbi:hypothetical protein AAZX31_17G079800 [Glycine max]|uniref:Uncharacterized protein n=2 Tax=Glycine subgen. Soja TaxID=1462606 RepID=K7MKK6_SOYBN|nr:uncharacterized protein LOC102662480 [Glycine max]XP_028208647.1 uncharacterized protein LOC114391852 [Glycine soja]KAH1201524.1 hypothetical protein GmHk_17G048202 [Glycine max]KHN18391.1 hypothetical protein glysoja_006804 [Glycine soja]KRH03188.1 hypothetical protein GLYMA_17G082400v4 [Glycine max]RZB55871.1 hypothetical protein D0Y65_045234 [Glycine soja]|eukprot:XP_006600608.1 uncharacterized protein LOC102662480 [Glycine max]
MVSARSTTFLLVFILLPLRFSSAHTQHQGKKTPVVAKLETKRSPVKVEIHHGVPAVAETDQRNRLLPGRKMMSKGVISKLINAVDSDNGINMAKGVTTKGKARCLNGNCKRETGKRILGLKHKDRKRSNIGRSTKAKMSGLVPLNADYYVPRPHPPKNN